MSLNSSEMEESIKEQLKKTIKLSKDIKELPEPKNSDQQQMLDEILKEIDDFNIELDKIFEIIK